MTDRYHSFVVVLDKDLRSDDAEATLVALRQIRGVIDVVPQITNVESLMAESRAETDLRSKILEALWPHLTKQKAPTHKTGE